MATIRVGDRVRFSSEFCRNTGQYTGDVPFARGVVTEVKPFGPGLAVVDWGNPDIPSKAMITNLEKCR